MSIKKQPTGVQDLIVVDSKEIFKGKRKVLVICRCINPEFSESEDVFRSVPYGGATCYKLFKDLGTNFHPDKIRGIVGTSFKALLAISKKNPDYVDIRYIIEVLPNSESPILTPPTQSTDSEITGSTAK